MKVLRDGLVYMVDNEQEVIKLLRNFPTTTCWSYYDDHSDKDFIENAVCNYDELPNEYPYALVLNFVDNGIFSHIETFGMSKTMFEKE